jgi:hypothetical protein
MQAQVSITVSCAPPTMSLVMGLMTLIFCIQQIKREE